MNRDRKLAQEPAYDRMAPVELVLDFNLQNVYTGHVEGELLQVKGHEREREREMVISKVEFLYLMKFDNIYTMHQQNRQQWGA